LISFASIRASRRSAFARFAHGAQRPLAASAVSPRCISHGRAKWLEREAWVLAPTRTLGALELHAESERSVRSGLATPADQLTCAAGEQA
jgi:hypothetical protein